MLFYSTDLRHWEFGSILDKSENKIGKMWECPDFFELNEKHILMISPQEMYAEGLEFHNGNNAAFLIGEYNKKEMGFHRTAVQSVDYGLDFYAPQTMLTEDVISTRSMHVESEYGILKLRILIDRYSVEIFVNDGKQAMTSLIYTPQNAVQILFESSGKAYMDIEKYELSL